MRSLSALLLTLFLLSAASGYAQHSNITTAFKLVYKPAVIEGMAYDKKDRNFYFGDNNTLNILRYTKAGKAIGFIDAGKAGMTSILGITVDTAHQLWACGSINNGDRQLACMFQFDLNNDRLVKYYPDTSGRATLFNDVVVTSNGNVFTTHPDLKAVYKVNRLNGLTELYMTSDSLSDANGITANGNNVFVSTSKGFAKINTNNKTLQLVQLNGYHIAGNDGLYYYKQSLIGIQNVFFPVTVGSYSLNKEETVVKEASVLCANHPSFNIPTTGAIVEDNFYFMVNTNLLSYDFENRHITDRKKITRIRVMKIKLSKK